MWWCAFPREQDGWMHVILAHSSARIGKSTALSRKYSSTISAHVSGNISSPEIETLDGGLDDGSTIRVWLNLIEIASISIDDGKCKPLHGTGITVSRMSPTTQLHLLCPEDTSTTMVERPCLGQEHLCGNTVCKNWCETCQCRWHWEHNQESCPPHVMAAFFCLLVHTIFGGGNKGVKQAHLVKHSADNLEQRHPHRCQHSQILNQKSENTLQNWLLLHPITQATWLQMVGGKSGTNSLMSSLDGAWTKWQWLGWDDDDDDAWRYPTPPRHFHHRDVFLHVPLPTCAAPRF